MQNRDPDTGFPYGYIRADAIFPELFDQLCYTNGKDANYDSALADHLAQKRREHEDSESEEEFDEDYERDQFAEAYQCDEPIYEGQHEGVHYRTSWLGGAQHLWVFRSPVLTKCRPCSPCVPGAGDLDSVGDYLAYGVPVDWLSGHFLVETCQKADLEIDDTFLDNNEKLEKLYSDNLQHKVGLTLDEIKAAVDAGKTVHWKNVGYKVIKGKYEYLIVYYDKDAIGLTHQDGVTMNGKPEDFFIG
jgi:hypothetical protein